MKPGEYIVIKVADIEEKKQNSIMLIHAYSNVDEALYNYHLGVVDTLQHFTLINNHKDLYEIIKWLAND